MKVEIREPIWKRPRSVGLASHLTQYDKIEVHITYKNANGDKLFPDPLYILGDELKKYPVQFKKGVQLHIVPIDNLRVKC